MMNPKRRRWKFYYVAGMPAELCDSGEMTAVEAAAKIIEESPDQRQQFLEFASAQFQARRGAVFLGARFLVVCTS